MLGRAGGPKRATTKWKALYERENEPKGKSPDSCCSSFANGMRESNFWFQDSSDKRPSLQVRTHQGLLEIRYCPFCGAKIIFKENLKLRVVETTVPRKTYNFEKI